jgi:hypothetical protein
VILSVVPPPHPGHPHAIVLIGMSEDDLFLCLDPMRPANEQPRGLSERGLVEIWTGQLIVCAAFA